MLIANNLAISLSIMSPTKQVIIGRFGRPYGVKGWLTVISFTVPIENILQYTPWQIKHKSGWVKLDLEEVKQHGKHILAKIPHINNPEDARAYTNLDIGIPREQLPNTAADELYWQDLEGLRVINLEGKELGTVKQILATGANDVLIVQEGRHERLLPYIKSVIQEVDLDKQQILVDWPEDF